MEYMPEFNSDRREFFRITDSVYIDFSELDSHEAERLVPIIRNPVHSDTSQHKQKLDSIQTHISHVIDQINQTDRDVAKALRLLDEKINLVTQSIQLQQSNSDDRDVIEANLSGGGIAFLVSDPISVKSAVEVHIEFLPSGSVIHAIANVIGCAKFYDAPKETPYLLRLVFSHMSESNRNLLVKHTLSRQALERRLSKEQGNN